MQNKFHLKIIFIFLLIFTSLTFNGCSIESKQIVPEIYKSVPTVNDPALFSCFSKYKNEER